jgi:hypothetical protein
MATKKDLHHFTAAMEEPLLLRERRKAFYLGLLQIAMQGKLEKTLRPPCCLISFDTLGEKFGMGRKGR